jgi:serine/threonine protein kinase
MVGGTMSDLAVQHVADFSILQRLRSIGNQQLWLAEPPDRLGVRVPGGGPARVTIKTIEHPSSEADFRRVVNQLQRYAAIPNPHLVPVYEVGRQDSLLYVAYAYVSPTGLAEHEPTRTRIDVLKAVAMAATGAHALHEAGLAHRAIQPDRIHPMDGGGLLGHIGLTQLLNPGMTIAHEERAEAMEYMAPELIQGRPASRASDIWALATTLHRALTGQPLYPHMPANSPLAAIRHILTSRPRLGDALRNGELKIIDAATSFDPSDRPATAAELAQALLDEAARQSRQANQ